MANIFEFLSKDGNITPEKARKSRQMPFHDKTAYVWMGILPLKKRVNCDKCSFATKQRMFGAFAIDEILRYRGTRYPVPALYATLPDKQTRKMLEYRELKWCFLISTDTSVCQIVVKALLRKLGIVDNTSLNWKHFKSNSDHNVLLSFAHKSTEEGIKGYLMNVMHLVKNSSPNLVT